MSDSDQTREHGKSASPPDREERQDTWRRRLEITATAVLALAAVLTAWSAFQSAKWSGLQAIAFADAGAARTESARAANLAGQQAQVDIGVFLRWLSAADEDIRNGLIERPDNAADYEPTVGTLSGFIFERMREEFRPALDAWLDTDPFGNPDAPDTPFDMPEYQLATAMEADRLLEDAQSRRADALDNNQQSDDYVLMAVIFASVLFFVGLSSKLQNPRTGLAMLIIGAALFIGASAVLLTFPIEI